VVLKIVAKLQRVLRLTQNCFWLSARAVAGHDSAMPKAILSVFKTTPSSFLYAIVSQKRFFGGERNGNKPFFVLALRRNIGGKRVRFILHRSHKGLASTGEVKP
jgi:hypothetical protein